jgi:hypothetical protein
VGFIAGIFRWTMWFVALVFLVLGLMGVAVLVIPGGAEWVVEHSSDNSSNQGSVDTEADARRFALFLAGGALSASVGAFLAGRRMHQWFGELTGQMTGSWSPTQARYPPPGVGPGPPGAGT